ncbi:unnamed protein product [Prunus armeniaca]
MQIASLSSLAHRYCSKQRLQSPSHWFPERLAEDVPQARLKEMCSFFISYKYPSLTLKQR